MKYNHIALLAALGGSLALTSQAQFSSFSWNGVNFVAGLQNVTDSSLLSGGNVSTSISYLTDSSLNTIVGNVGVAAGGVGNLAGDFGGGSYFAGANDIVLVGPSVAGQPYWGTFNVSLLLSDSTYTAPATYSDANITAAGYNDQTAYNIWDGQTGSGSTQTFGAGQVPLGYLDIPISSYATGGLGVTGIEINNVSPFYPDISFIGVSTPVAAPEPGTLALGAFGLAGWVAARRRAAK